MSWTEEQYAEHLARLKQPAEAPAPKCDMSEALIQEECIKLLEADRWRHLRTDPVSDKARGKGFGEIGMADSLFIRYKCTYGLWTKRRNGPDATWLAESEVLWVEWKAPRGKPSKRQLAWHIRERARGALTLIAGQDFTASVEGFRAWYNASGLARRTV